MIGDHRVDNCVTALILGVAGGRELKYDMKSMLADLIRQFDSVHDWWKPIIDREGEVPEGETCITSHTLLLGAHHIDSTFIYQSNECSARICDQTDISRAPSLQKASN